MKETTPELSNRIQNSKPLKIEMGLFYTSFTKEFEIPLSAERGLDKDLWRRG